jgi:hypothetical protein
LPSLCACVLTHYFVILHFRTWYVENLSVLFCLHLVDKSRNTQ